MKIIGDNHEAFAIIHVATNDNRILRNVEYFTFSGAKIKSIEVFFASSGQGDFQRTQSHKVFMHEDRGRVAYLLGGGKHLSTAKI